MNARNNISYSNPTINLVGTENVCLVSLKKLHTATGNSYTRRYNYQNGTNKLTDIDNNQSAPTVIANFSYDIVGNQIKCGTERYYEWDYCNRMKAFYNQAGTGVEPSVYAVYLYDGGGNRTKKLVRKQGGNWESVTYIDGTFEYHKKGTEEKNYTQIANIEIRTGSYSGDVSDSVLYQMKDHLGSVGLRINQSGTTIDREEYYPFGDSSLRTFSKKRYRYVGKEKDLESGLYYYGARYYAAWACRFISIDPLAGDFPWQSSYVGFNNNPMKFIDPDGRAPFDWILLTGDKAYWYGGNYGDTKELKYVFKASSGMDNVTMADGSIRDFQNSTYQYMKDVGPTVEGRYKINLEPKPNRVAKADNKTGILLRSPLGGIEQIPYFIPTADNPDVGWTYQAWGTQRARLEPVNVSQPKDINGIIYKRDLNSFYIHDSEKGYSHGCHEVETKLFDQLIDYRSNGNISIDVKVEYPSKNHNTNGGTKQNDQ